MLLERIALFGDGRRGWGFSGKHLAGLSEDPGVSDAAARDAGGVDAGEGEHSEYLVHIPHIAGAEDDAIGAGFHKIAQECPAAGADVFLFDGAPVDSRPGVANFVRGVEDGEEVPFGFG